MLAPARSPSTSALTSASIEETRSSKIDVACATAVT